MSDDIVARLRDEAQRPAIREVCSEAADTIERLYAAGDALEHSLLMWQSKHPHLDLGYDALAAALALGAVPLAHLRTASDITDEHVQSAADEREGWNGEKPTPWEDVINNLERFSMEDWGTDPDSEAIIELKRRVREELRARRG